MNDFDEYTSYLYAEPSFLEGAARVLDIGGTLQEYNRSPDPDTRALTADMYAIGHDMRKAVAIFESEHPEARDQA